MCYHSWQITNYSVLINHHSSLFAQPSSITTDYYWLIAHCPLPITHYSVLFSLYFPSSFITHQSSPITHASLLITQCSLLNIHSSLLLTHYTSLLTHHSVAILPYPLLITHHSLRITISHDSRPVVIITHHPSLTSESPYTITAWCTTTILVESYVVPSFA